MTDKHMSHHLCTFVPPLAAKPSLLLAETIRVLCWLWQITNVMGGQHNTHPLAQVQEALILSLTTSLMQAISPSDLEKLPSDMPSR